MDVDVTNHGRTGRFQPLAPKVLVPRTPVACSPHRELSERQLKNQEAIFKPSRFARR